MARSRIDYARLAPASLSAIVIFIILSHQAAEAFRVSFAHRLLKSIQQHQNNPQLNPPDTLIRPIECRNANNHSEAGICMFSIDCMQNKGVPLSICKHNYFVGTCCKLPDYNNFVGIVYDLRETETANQQLEARRSASGQLDANSLQKVAPLKLAQSISAPPTTLTNDEAKQTQLNSTVSTHLNAESPTGSEIATLLATISHLERRSTVSQTEGEESSPTNQQQQDFVTASTTPQSRLADKFLLDEKYIISSTKLFPETPASSSTLRPSSSSYNLVFPQSKGAMETGRNADGSSQLSSLTNSEIVKQLSNETGTSGSAQVTYAAGSSGDQQVAGHLGAYELVGAPNKTNELELSQPAGLDIVQGTLLSSAHSAPSRLNSNQQQQQNSVYLVGDESEPMTQKDVPTSIVFSSNHQPSSEASRQQQQPPPQVIAVSGPQPTTDQEFTLSTSSERNEESASSSSVSSLILSSSSLAPSTSTQAQAHTQSSTASSTTSTTSTTQAPSSAQSHAATLTSQSSATLSSAPLAQQSTSAPPSAEPTASPFVDLISSAHSTAQTTTPFTSSLSTALLPNVSSHPYAPTTLAPLASSSSNPSNSNSTPTQPALPASGFPHQALVSSPSSSSSSSSSSKQPAGSEPIATSSSSAPLFYSTAQAGGLAHQPSEMSSNSDGLAHHSGAHSSRPAGSILQAASKIVTSNSATNNLIPGLSGLQSAILSHMPFKIASGLSSGLQSYLQAAMKPNGAQRPLISSNTAPALQYQHHQSQNNATGSQHSSKPAAHSPSQQQQQQSAIRFPMPSSPPAPSSTSFASPAAPQATSGERDLQREAQLVCGRPQLGAQEASVSKKRVARIVGGNQSAFGQWPWMVSLRQWRKGAFLHKCGAALLNENWAITAAHCVENVKASDLLLRLGEFDVSNQNEPFPFTERRVKQVVSHPSFDPKTFEYDLALIKFTEPVQFERNIIPVCVPTGNDSYVDRMATVIGWGRLYEDGPLPDVIQHVDVPIITNEECEKMYKNAGFVEEIPEMFICAGISKGGRDSCEGDSGGPLTMIDHDGRSYLVGIISWGIGCALPSQPGVYTRITAFSPWIQSILTS